MKQDGLIQEIEGKQRVKLTFKGLKKIQEFKSCYLIDLTFIQQAGLMAKPLMCCTKGLGFDPQKTLLRIGYK